MTDPNSPEGPWERPPSVGHGALASSLACPAVTTRLGAGTPSMQCPCGQPGKLSQGLGSSDEPSRGSSDPWGHLGGNEVAPPPALLWWPPRTSVLSRHGHSLLLPSESHPVVFRKCGLYQKTFHRFDSK